MEQQIANRSTSKSKYEMNRKNNEGYHSRHSNANSSAHHKFSYETEEQQKMRTKSLVKPQSARPRGHGPPEYMKNTVNYDLKKGKQVTVSKSKQLMIEA